MAIIEQVIVKPLITEKVSSQTEKSNRYGFEVKLRSNKNQIKEAVELLYDVKVLNVHTNITPGTVKRVKNGYKKSAKTKKALVQLAEGQRIEFYKGV